MSFALIQKVNDQQKKPAVVDVRSGDTVRVHQKIKEGNKERIQMFEGVVIRTDNKGQHTSRITVRKSYQWCGGREVVLTAQSTG